MLTVDEHMRPAVTVLLVLMIGSMLVGTAVAECAAMNMLCCAQHHRTACHEICAAPASNVGNATLPQLASDLQSAVTVLPALPAPPRVAAYVQPTFTPSAEDLLMRIHVLLI